MYFLKNSLSQILNVRLELSPFQQMNHHRLWAESYAKVYSVYYRVLKSPPQPFFGMPHNALSKGDIAKNG